MELDTELLVKELARQEQLKIECDEMNYYKDQYSNSHEREIERLKSLIEFSKLPVDVSEYTDGSVLVNGVYVFTLRTHRWRVLNKNTWYKSKNAKDFVERFVLK
jgi:hypothetical protein